MVTMDSSGNRMRTHTERDRSYTFHFLFSRSLLDQQLECGHVYDLLPILSPTVLIRVVLLRRTSLIVLSVVAYTDRDALYASITVLNLIWLLLHIYFRPFIRPMDNIV